MATAPPATDRTEPREKVDFLKQTAEGKTTLAASYTKTSKAPSAWVNLDRKDSDPVNLFHLIVQSLQHALAGSTCPLLSLIRSKCWERKQTFPSTEDGPMPYSSRSPSPFASSSMVWTRIPHDAPVFQLLQVYWTLRRRIVRLMMLSRDVPPFHSKLNISK